VREAGRARGQRARALERKGYQPSGAARAAAQEVQLFPFLLSSAFCNTMVARVEDARVQVPQCGEVCQRRERPE
jgi:hypothetical protein